MSNDAADGLNKAVVRLHLWLERGGGTLFGMGRLQLLERIEAGGSIKVAAEDLGMSYRAAWGKLKASEEALGMQLTEKTGGNKSGCSLTPQGRAMARAYRKWFAEVERHAVATAAELFPFGCGHFCEPNEAKRRDCCVQFSIPATQNTLK